MGLIIQGPQANPQYLYGYMAFDTVTADPLAGAVNNLDIAGMFFASQLNLPASEAVTLTGLAQGRPGKIVTLNNTSAYDITLSANDVNSIAANRFAASATIGAGTTLQVIYDGDSELWLPQSAGAGSSGGGSVVILNAIISPAALPNDVTDDYDPTGLSTCNVMRLSPDVLGSTLGGLAASATSQEIVVFNITAGDLIFAHEWAQSVEANRFLCPGATDYTVIQNGRATLFYDLTSARWRVQ